MPKRNGDGSSCQCRTAFDLSVNKVKRFSWWTYQIADLVKWKTIAEQFPPT